MKRIFTYILLTLIVVACHVDMPQKPLSQFKFMPEGSCNAPCSVTFTSNSENAANLQWDFGDESELVTGDSVTHEYLTAGTFQVKLIVRGIDGGSSGSTQAVKIEEPIPAEAFSISGGFNFPTDIASDANGNVYVSGTGKGTINFGYKKSLTTNSDSEDFFVAKYNSSGQCQWVYMDGSPGDDHANALVLDNNGDVFITGFVSGSLSKLSLTTRGGFDGFVAKIDGATGQPAWAKTFGGPLNDQGRSLDFDDRGEGPKLYLTGVVEGDNQKSDIFFDNFSQKADARDGFFTMINLDTREFGTPYMIGGPNAQVPETITIDDQGNAYIAGAFLKSIQFTGLAQTAITSVDSVDIFVTKWGLINRKFAWATTAGSDGVDFAYDILVDKDKNVYVTGMHTGNMSKLNLFSAGDENAYLAKWNANGVPIAGNNGFNNADRDYHGGIAMRDNGNIIMAGSFFGTGRFPMTNSKTVSGRGSTDIIITEVNANGLTPTNFLKSDGGLLEDRVNKICITKSGYVYATGWFKGPSVFNDVTLSAPSQDRNTFITRYKIP